jgi:tetratricopeptide (TPR) repeat protein
VTPARKGTYVAPFLIILLAALLALPSFSQAAEKKSQKKAPPAVTAAQRASGVNDVTLQDHFKAGEEHLKKGRLDDALRSFQGVYAYTRDALLLVQCVRGPYEKALNDPALNQNQKEDLYVKVQRVNSLATRYAGLKTDSAYNVGLVLSKKGEFEQARKYLLEACQSAPFSLNSTSTWQKSKNLLLALFHLEGEF